MPGDVPKKRARPKPTLMSNLGGLVGGILGGIKAKPAPKRRVVSRKVSEAQAQTPDGPVILRRTVVDEVIVPKHPRR